jgi:hypothetical protein
MLNCRQQVASGVQVVCTHLEAGDTNLTQNMLPPADETVDGLRMLATATTPQEVDAILQPMLAS